MICHLRKGRGFNLKEKKGRRLVSGTRPKLEGVGAGREATSSPTAPPTPALSPRPAGGQRASPSARFLALAGRTERCGPATTHPREPVEPHTGLHCFHVAFRSGSPLVVKQKPGAWQSVALGHGGRDCRGRAHRDGDTRLDRTRGRQPDRPWTWRGSGPARGACDREQVLSIQGVMAASPEGARQ